MRDMRALSLHDRDHYLRWLAWFNERVLLKTFGADVVGRLKNRSSDQEECLSSCTTLEDTLFVDTSESCGIRNVATVMRDDPVTFRQMTDSLTGGISVDQLRLADSLLEHGIVPLLVRPEFLYLREAVCNLLAQYDIRVVAEQVKQISFRQYWIIYEHVFGHPVKEMHVRRRAFGYLNRPSYLFLLQAEGRDSQSLSRLLIKEVKGSAGIFTEKTLRGDVVFREVSEILSIGKPEYLFALDPLMEYVYNDDSIYNEGVVSKMHANLQGVHIPEPHEVRKDLCVLVKKGDIKKLIL